MNISTIKGVAIEAVSACVPSKTINNREYAKEFLKGDMESTISALGIEERHICRFDTTTAMDFCIRAAEKIFETGISKEDIGAIVFVTLTPDYLMPNNASYAQHLLGLPQDIAAFDINHACSGFVYGLWNAALIAGNIGKKVLLLDGDVNSHYVSPWDNATSLLFGDAGTAAIISPAPASQSWNFTFNTDGSNRDTILMKLGFRHLIKPEYLEYIEYDNNSKRRFIDMQMDGEAVFKYVVSKVPKIVTEFLDELESDPVEYSHLLLHQANAFMLRKLTRKIGFTFEQMPLSINKYGNTSSASIPLTICSELVNNEIKDVLLVGMGAGLATGIGRINMSGLRNVGVIEIDL
jgi:3-oxoacyl-[acyl-carrier-protein] synthase III